jgi:glycosyltransferase involved in cell wall biosynthesis
LSARDPLLSVVVPTKGRPAYLHGCLCALAASDYPRDRFEVVVVSDGGGPEVDEIASSFGDRLFVRVTAPDKPGPSAARNAGAAVARGRHVAFTDDDCEPAPRWLGEVEGALERNPGAAVGGETRNGATRNRPAVATQIVVDAVHAHFNRDPDAPRFFASSNLAFPLATFRGTGGFDERFRYAEDREMCERWLESGHRFVHAPAALVFHMRRLTLREFMGQHYGYGRGAAALHRAHPLAVDRRGVLAALAREVMRRGSDGHRAAIAGYIALSQFATVAGVGRETIASRLPPQAVSDGAIQR